MALASLSFMAWMRRLDLGLVQPHHLVVFVHVDVQGLAQGDQEVLLVHLRMALDRLMLDARRSRAARRRSFSSGQRE